MNNSDKMLQLVLSDKNLITTFEINSENYLTVNDALKSDNPIVVTIAKVLQGVTKNPDSSNFKDVYNEIINYLNKNLL
jgi:hypothetical protein